MMRSPGRHRLEAARILGWEDIPAVVSDGTETEAKMWEIAENLHRADVCPAKAGMFSRRQTCRGKSQSPVVWIAEVMETETLKPIDKVPLGEATSHRAVTKVNALWPRK
jgi:ParB-like chromosome segregation protein Spo0J